MPMFFKPDDAETRRVELVEELTELVGSLEGGSVSGIITTDALSQAILQYSAIANALNSEVPAYYLSPANSFSLKLLSKLTEKRDVLLGRIYSMDDLLGALKRVEDDSLVFVAGFSVLMDRSAEGMLALRRIVDDRNLMLVLSHSTLELNELDLTGEFRRLFIIPGLFELLMVMRTNSYRGHYRLNLSIIKAPPDFIRNIGEHSIPIDSRAKLFLG
ncbi:hypothetical protein [Thermococcus sp.]